MKTYAAFFLLVLAGHSSLGQSTPVIQTRHGLGLNDLQHILYFEGISHEKFSIKSDSLKGKNYQIIIKEFKEGKLIKTDTVFNSKEDEYFRIKTDSLSFAVLTKMSDLNYFKIQFQFDGFSSDRKYPVSPARKDKFALKSFFGPKSELPVNLNGLNYFLAYMTPYVRKDKSEAYCEVAQSGIDPEKLYDKYKIPHYFLTAIRFE
jgi:hypothetical protein